MFVRLRQYKHEEVQFDDNRTTGESQTEDSVNPDAEEYFGKEMDELAVETWETVEYRGDPIQRRSVTIDGASTVSVSEDGDANDPDLPGKTVQFQTEGDQKSLEQATIVEVQAERPQES